MNIKELQARLSAIREEAQQIVDAADKNEDSPGQFTEEQSEKFDALMSERETVEANIGRLEKLEGMGQSTGRRAAPQQVPSPRIEVTHGVEEDPMCGFSSASEFGQIVKQASLPGSSIGQTDERLKVLGAPSNFHRETSSSDGYMVPPAIRESIWSLAFDEESLLASVSPEPTESNQVQLYADESTPWGSSGVQANWASEGSQMDPSRLTTEARNVQLHKLYAFVLATDELLADAPRLQSRLTTQAARAIRWKADSAIVEGDGVGKPLGWNNSGALITVAKESGQSADTIVAQNVLKMFSRLLQMGRTGAYWLVNSSTVPQLSTMTIGDQPIWTPPQTGLTQAPGGFLLGRPIRFSEHAELLGDKGDIQLVSPSGYYATNKAGGIDFAASMHLYFDYDVEAFRWTFRLGGQPYLSAPVNPAKGGSSNTKSHFITLAERA